MVEAQIPHGVYFTCIGCVKSVLALWYAMDGLMGSPSLCYACAGLGWIFEDIEVDLSPSDVVLSWLKLKPPMECMYTKCFSTLISYDYEWAYGSTLTLLCLYKLGVEFWGYWGRPEPEWCCNVMVEAQTPHGMQSISIRYEYKVFYHHDMLWVGIWVHLHTDMPKQVVGGGFLGILG